MDTFDHLPCALLITDTAGLVVHANSELLALMGCTPSPLYTQPMATLLTPASRLLLQTYVWPMLLRTERVSEIYLHLCSATQPRIPVMVNGQKRQWAGAACYFWVIFVAKERSRYEAELLLARTQAQRISTHLAQAHTELKALHQQLEQRSVVIQTENRALTDLSHTDALTGLANRRALGLRVAQWRAQAPLGAYAALLMVDVDHFKAVNDRHGHPEGDSVLQALANQLKHSMRASDLAVRYGGEEFVMWLPLADRKGADRAARRVHANVRRVQVAGKPITVSIGIATARHTPGLDLLQLLSQSADQALYEAKAAGRNRSVHAQTARATQGQAF